MLGCGLQFWCLCAGLRVVCCIWIFGYCGVVWILLEFWWFAVNFDAMWAGASQLCSLADLRCCYLVLG